MRIVHDATISYICVSVDVYLVVAFTILLCSELFLKSLIAQSAEAVAYTNCFSAEW